MGVVLLWTEHGRNGMIQVNSPKRQIAVLQYLRENHPEVVIPTAKEEVAMPSADTTISLIPAAPVSFSASDVPTQEKPLLLQEHKVTEGYFILGYHENIPGICDLVIEVDPMRDRNAAIDAATNWAEDYCRLSGLDFARDVAWEQLAAPLPAGIAIKPLADCKIDQDAPNDARALLVDMANAMAKLFGVCELNMDDLEESTCDTLTECDALLDRVRSYLASN
jgi:hypothetical protein